jgi:hypothetical protein
MRGITVDHHQAVATRAAEKYVLGELPAGAREEFEEHFFHCTDCAQDVRDLSSLAASARTMVNQPSVSESSAENAAGGMDGWPLPWLHPKAGLALAGALLAMTILAVYQTFELRRLNRPQAPTSFVLRPELRVEAAPITLQPGARFVLLESELPDSSGALRWDLRREGANYILAEETAEAPHPGALFKVLTPSSLLTAGEYRLTVRSVAAPGKTWLLRFRIVQGSR